MLVRGVGTVLLLALLVWWWAVPAILHADVIDVADELSSGSDEPVCASWSFGAAEPATDGVGIPVTVVVRPCDG